jgi:hypothetical protein
VKTRRCVVIHLVAWSALALMVSCASAVAARPRGACHRLAGHDRAPAPSVKVVSNAWGLYGCVFSHGPVRELASADRGEGFRLRAVAGAVVLFDQDFNNAYIRAHRTMVYDLRRGRRYALAAEESGDASSAGATFRAPVAFVDPRGCAVAALVSTATAAPDVTITRFDPAGAATVLDQDSAAQQLPPSSLTRTGAAVSWRHAGAARTAALC